MKKILVLIVIFFVGLSATAEVLTGKIELKDRVIVTFSDNSSAVQFHKNPLEVLYYDSNKKLTHIEHKDSLDFPYKAYKYDTRGQLVTMSLRISKTETYIYNATGRLLAHWIGPNAYDASGRVIMTREYLE